jgi:outer membrane protein OmpA-like peptidoglycan-associated protein
MTTLLLTFFVMLLGLANMMDPELFYRGRGSFMQSMRELGLGMLFNRKRAPEFGSVKIKYFIETPDKQFPGRTIHAKEEEIRRLFKEVQRSMETMPSQIVAKKTIFSVTNVRFPPGEATLNGEAARFLTEFCLDLQADLSDEAIKLYVLGLARDEAAEKQQWILSAGRAQVVADFLRDTLPSASNWPVYSWGAGPGGDWVGQDSPISKQTQILIAVLRAGD